MRTVLSDASGHQQHREYSAHHRTQVAAVVSELAARVSGGLEPRVFRSFVVAIPYRSTPRQLTLLEFLTAVAGQLSTVEAIVVDTLLALLESNMDAAIRDALAPATGGDSPDGSPGATHDTLVDGFGGVTSTAWLTVGSDGSSFETRHASVTQRLRLCTAVVELCAKLGGVLTTTSADDVRTALSHALQEVVSIVCDHVR